MNIGAGTPALSGILYGITIVVAENGFLISMPPDVVFDETGFPMGPPHPRIFVARDEAELLAMLPDLLKRKTQPAPDHGVPLAFRGGTGPTCGFADCIMQSPMARPGGGVTCPVCVARVNSEGGEAS
jgi:hypothetical protein